MASDELEKDSESPEFEAVIAQFKSDYPDMDLRALKEAKIRQVVPDDWKVSKIHYEFRHYKRNETVGVELHLEDEKVLHLGNLLKSFEGKKIGGYQIEWLSEWLVTGQRIKIEVPFTEGKVFISNMMHDLIELTQEKVEKALLES